MSKQSLGRVSMVPKGAYNALTAYERLDVVTHDGASYIVLRPVQGVTPVDGEDYMLLVQDGDTPDLSIGTVETLAAGSKATASIGGTPDKPELNLSIPKGDTGAAPVLKMGKVTTLEPGSEATASLSGTAEEPELNLSIPRGASGGVDVASAAVGQTIIVKAVDENGKPTEWEAADMASGGGGLLADCELIASGVTTEDGAIFVSKDNDGNAFLLKKAVLILKGGYANPSNCNTVRFVGTKNAINANVWGPGDKVLETWIIGQIGERVTVKIYNNDKTVFELPNDSGLSVDESGAVTMPTALAFELTSIESRNWAGSAVPAAGTNYALYGVRA